MNTRKFVYLCFCFIGEFPFSNMIIWILENSFKFVMIMSHVLTLFAKDMGRNVKPLHRIHVLVSRLNAG